MTLGNTEGQTGYVSESAASVAMHRRIQTRKPESNVFATARLSGDPGFVLSFAKFNKYQQECSRGSGLPRDRPRPNQNGVSCHSFNPRTIASSSQSKNLA